MKNTVLAMTLTLAATHAFADQAASPLKSFNDLTIDDKYAMVECQAQEMNQDHKEQVQKLQEEVRKKHPQSEDPRMDALTELYFHFAVGYYICGQKLHIDPNTMPTPPILMQYPDLKIPMS